MKRKASPANRKPNTKLVDKHDPLPALKRAAKKALELAIQTGTPCYVMNERNEIIDIAKQSTNKTKKTARKKS